MQNESNSYTMYGFPYHGDYCDPVPLLGQTHTGMTCTVMTFCAVIMKQIQRNEEIGRNLYQNENHAGIM